MSSNKQNKMPCECACHTHKKPYDAEEAMLKIIKQKEFIEEVQYDIDEEGFTLVEAIDYTEEQSEELINMMAGYVLHYFNKD